MKDKIKAYTKISRTIESSRNEMHLQTCSAMLGIFNVRYSDESMKLFLRNAIRRKRVYLKNSRYKDMPLFNP